MRTYSWTSRTAFLSLSWMNASTRWSAPLRRARQPQLGVAQAFDVVTERRGLFEIQIGRGRLHLALQRRDIGIELRLRAELFGWVVRDGGRHVIALVDARHDVVDRFDDGLGRDPVLRVVGLLQRPPPPGLADGGPHRVGRLVSVHAYLSIHVSRRPPGCLDERPGGPQEPFFIGIENGHQRYLRQTQKGS